MAEDDTFPSDELDEEEEGEEELDKDPDALIDEEDDDLKDFGAGEEIE